MIEKIESILTPKNITIGVSWALYSILIYMMFVGYFVTPPVWWTTH